MFTICGARGDLSATPHGPPVDYESTKLPDADAYYYEPSGDCIFVDHNGLVERVMTCSGGTECNPHFRNDVVRRDGICVISRISADLCDAAHLIPECKDSGYIQKVVQDRSPLYGTTSPPSISDIDAVENGLLLDKTTHAMLDWGAVAFIKTPSSVSGVELDPTDIPRFDQGSKLTDHITLQQLRKATHDDPDLLETLADMGMLDASVAFINGAHVDALFRGTGSPRPPTIILDYMYGVAAYRRWRFEGNVHGVMKNYHEDHYAHIPAPPRGPSSDDDYDAPPEDLDKCKDPNYSTSLQPRPHKSTRGEEMARAMDELNSVLMFLQGITPEELANRRRKQMEEEELKA